MRDRKSESEGGWEGEGSKERESKSERERERERESGASVGASCHENQSNKVSRNSCANGYSLTVKLIASGSKNTPRR